MTDETTYDPYGDGVDRGPYGQAAHEHAHDAAGGSHRVIPGELVPREDPNSGASPYGGGPQAATPHAAPAAPSGPALSQAQPPSAQPHPTPQPYAPHPHAPVPYQAPQGGPHAYGPPVQPVAVVQVQAPKSVAVSLVLTFFFGAFGMFYSTVPGALIMLGAALAYGALAGILTVVTLGAAAIVLVPLAILFWPICMVWGAVAASNHNARLQRQSAALYGAPFPR